MTRPAPDGAPALVLIGLRGSGKSTIGRLVASRAGAAFVDLDELTSRLLGGGEVAEIWARVGEPGFRDGEARALRDLNLDARGGPRVIALGGGTPTAPGAAELLESASRAGAVTLVYLRAAPGVLRARLGATDVASRPSLTGAGTLREIEAVFAARDPLYRRLATLVLETDDLSVEDLADRLAPLIGEPHRPRAPRGRTP